MTIIEGPIHRIESWSNGKGLDVYLHEDEKKYFCQGQMDIKKHLGKACSFEIIDGTGDRKGQCEILSCKPLIANPEIEPPKVPVNAQGVKMIQLPWEQFQEAISNKNYLQQSKKEALMRAVATYDAMHDIERSPVAAAHKVIEIATLFEGYLV